MINRYELASQVGEEMADAIASLSSEDLATRKEASQVLFDICWYQGTVYEQSSVAVPFLIERLTAETDISLLSEIIWQLYHLGTGTSFLNRPTSLHNQERQNPPEYQTEIAEKLLSEVATHQEFHQGIDVYLQLLEHDAHTIRVHAAYCLSCCTVRTGYICSKLYQHFAKEADENVRATIPLCLAFLSKTESINLDFLESILNKEETDFVKLSVCVALAFIAREKLSNHAISSLSNLIAKPNLLARLSNHYDSPMSTAHYYTISDLLGYLSDEHLCQFLPHAIEPIESVYGYDELITMVFPDEKIVPGTTFNQLSPPQQYLLKEICQQNSTGKEYIYRTSSLSFMGISRTAGRRDKLVEFINGKPDNLIFWNN